MIKLYHILMITPIFPQVAVASGGVCPAGYVCPHGTMYPQQHPCPVGTWSSTVGAQNLSSCWPCPPGLYCNSTGLSQPSGICDAGMEINYPVQQGVRSNLMFQNIRHMKKKYRSQCLITCRHLRWSVFYICPLTILWVGEAACPSFLLYVHSFYIYIYFDL